MHHLIDRNIDFGLIPIINFKVVISRYQKERRISCDTLSAAQNILSDFLIQSSVFHFPIQIRRDLQLLINVIKTQSECSGNKIFFFLTIL